MVTEGYEFTKQEINPDSLQQDKIWYNRSGTRYVIKEMNKFHALNAAKKLKGWFGMSCINTPLYRALISQSRYGA